MSSTSERNVDASDRIFSYDEELHKQLNSKTFTSASDIWKEVMYYINILVLIIR